MENQPTMPQDPTVSPKTASRRGLTRDAVVASICGLVVVLMVGASYAAVPFYNWFCRATGFNGTTQVATAAPAGAAPAGRRAAGAQDRGALRCQCRARAAVEVRAGADRNRG